MHWSGLLVLISVMLSVAPTVNAQPVFDSFGYDFTLGFRDTNGEAVVGTVSATGGLVVNYAMISGDTNKFSVDLVSGEVSYVGGVGVLEDASLTPSYTLTVQATDVLTIGVPRSSVNVVVSIGICDRTEGIRWILDFIINNRDFIDEISDTGCRNISLAELNDVAEEADVGIDTYNVAGNYDIAAGEFTYLAGRNEILTSLQPFDLGGLISVSLVRIAGSFGRLATEQTVHEFTTLPSGLFDNLPELDTIVVDHTNIMDLPFDIFDGVISPDKTYHIDFRHTPGEGSINTTLLLKQVPDQDGQRVLEVSTTRKGIPTRVSVVYVNENSNTAPAPPAQVITLIGATVAEVRSNLNLSTSAFLSNGEIFPGDGNVFLGMDDDNVFVNPAHVILDIPRFERPNGYSFSLVPGSPAGTIIGTVSASDPNTGAPPSYTIAAPFNIDALGVVRYFGQDDLTATAPYNLTAIALDNDSSLLDVGVPLTVSINVPSVLGDSNFALEPRPTQNLGNAVVVGTLAATDAEGDAITYTITSGNTDKFSVNDNGVLSYIGGVIEDETLTPSYTITIAPLSTNQSGDVATVIIEIGICDRTDLIRDEIIATLNDQNGVTDFDCARVTATDLASILKSAGTNTTGDFDLSAANRLGDAITSLISVDFAGLSGVQRILLNGNTLNNLPAGVFDGLNNLAELSLQNNNLGSLPLGVFDGLTNLNHLRLYENALSNLREGVFDTLTNLGTLRLDENQLDTLPEGVFDALTNLHTLWLRFNQLDLLPQGIFDTLINLDTLLLNENLFGTLPEGVFDALINLDTLALSGNRLDLLPDGLFDTLTNLGNLRLDSNQLVTLPDGLFDALTALGVLQLGNNQLVTLPDGVFNALTSLVTLHLQNNNLTVLPEGVFEGLFSDVPSYYVQMGDNPEIGFGLVNQISAEELPNENGMAVFRARSSIPGPPITVTWTAYDLTETLPAIGGTLNIPLGAATSVGIPINLGYTQVELSNAVVSDPPLTSTADSFFTGLVLQEDTPLLVGAPLFDQPDGYVFYSLSPNSVSGAVVGTVTAIDRNAIEPTPYRIVDTSPDSADGIFDINEDGVIRYFGSGNEISGDIYTLIVEAEDDIHISLNTSVTIAIVIDTAPVIPPSLVAFLGLRSGSNNQIEIGQVPVIEVDDHAVTYSIIGADFSKFSISQSGMLTYIGTGIEDVTINPSYTITIGVSDGILSTNEALTVRVGICDRTDLIQDEIIASLNDQSGVTDFDCRIVTVDHLASILKSVGTDEAGAFDLSTANRLGDEFTSLISVDFAGLSGVQRILLNGNALSNLPAGVFGGLSNISELMLVSNGLSSLPSGVFDDLSNLSSLHLNFNNLSTLPDRIFNSLPNLNFLRLNSNNFSNLQLDLFENVFTDTGMRTVILDNNPGLPFLADLSLEQLLDQNGETAYIVRNSRPGPPIEVTLLATDAEGNTSERTVAIPISAATSDVTSLPVRFTNIALRSALVVDSFGSIFSGIDVTSPVDDTPLVLGLPQYDQPDGYTFRTLYPDSTPGVILGTVAAIDPNTRATPAYTITEPEEASGTFAVGVNGAIAYIGTGNETVADTYTLIVTAMDNTGDDALSTTVAVTIVINSPPLLDVTAPLYLGSRTPGVNQIVVGTVTAIDVDGDAISGYQITEVMEIASGRAVSDKFTITPDGVLLYIGNDTEDVTITPSYVVVIRADDGGQQRGGQLGQTVAVTVNIGICDRTQPVRAAIVAGAGVSDCTQITESILNNFTGDGGNAFFVNYESDTLNLDPTQTGSQIIPSLISIDFAGLNSIQRILLSNNLLHTLPSGLFRDLDNVAVITLSSNQLYTLDADTFADLPTLGAILLNNNRLTALPVEIFNDQIGLQRLWLNDNLFNTLPQGVFDDNILLSELLLHNNLLSRNGLPESIFAGLDSLYANGVGRLWVDNNPGAPFPIELSVGQLLDVAGDTRFEVRTDRPGAPIDVVVIATDVLGSTVSSTIMIDAGATTSGMITLRADASTVSFSTIGLSNPEFRDEEPDNPRYRGFDLNLAFEIILDAPQFDRSSYAFTQVSNDTRQVPIALGTVTAVDPNGETPFYAIDSGDTSRFSIHSGNGVISYIGGGAETVADYAVVVVASDGGGLANTAAVTININTIPTLTTNTGSLSLYLGRRTLDSEIVLGTISAIDSDGDVVVVSRYAITEITAATPARSTDGFTIDVNGILRFVSSEIEDVTLNASYAITVEATVGGQDLSIPLTLNIGICDRTLEVWDNYVANCATVATTTLNNVGLIPDSNGNDFVLNLDPDINGHLITALNRIDFAGLINLQFLVLSDNLLSSLPDGVFDDLGNLVVLTLEDNFFKSLPVDVFSGLASLEHLQLYNNELSDLPAGVFNGLDRLETLQLYDNLLSDLPAGVFGGLGSLDTLQLQNNQLENLSAGVFDGLGNLITLGLDSNQFVTLPAGVFGDLGSLETLQLQNNQLDSLSVGVFDGLGNMTSLQLQDNLLESLPVGVFDGLGNMTFLQLQMNQLESLPTGVFDNLGSLALLRLDNNRLNNLQVDMFDDLGNLTSLQLQNNLLDSLPGGLFDSTVNLTTLSLYDNLLESLPGGLFNSLGNLTSLDLDNNRLNNLLPNAFSGLVSLETLALHNNSLDNLLEEVFSDLSSLETLQLQNNNLDELPASLFLGLTNNVQLQVDNNPGAPFSIELSLDYQLQSAIGQDRFEIRSSRPGPAFTVTWIATGSTSGSSDSGTVNIAAGVVNSEQFFLPTGFTTITLSNLVFTDDPAGDRYLGFRLPTNTRIVLGAPLFDQSSYTFTQASDDTRTPPIPLGTVTAIDADGGPSIYSISMGDTSRFTINSNSGVISYIGGGSETIASRVLIVAASNGVLANTVSVTLNINAIPVLAAPGGPFYLSSRNTAEIVLVTVVAADTNGDAISVSITEVTADSPDTITTDKFEIDENGVLSFVGLFFEDVFLNSNYNVTLQATTADGQILTITVPINIGICDRTLQVRTAIIAASGGVESCETVTTAALGNVVGELNLNPDQIDENDGGTITSLVGIDFIGLTNLDTLTLGNNLLISLPTGVFAGLSNLRTLNLFSNDINALSVDVFADLHGLRGLDIGDNLLVSLPAGVFDGLTNLASLQLDSNFLGVDSLPTDLFLGLTNLDDPTSALLRVDRGEFDNTNPGAPFLIFLAVEVSGDLSPTTGEKQFVVRSYRPGPPLAVTWTATNPLTSTSISGTAIIPAGEATSPVISPLLGFTVITLSAPGFDNDPDPANPRYRGFELLLDPSPVTLGAPRFNVSNGYAFELNKNRDGSLNQIVVGTITAFDLENDPINYSIIAGDLSRFAINTASGNGIFRYVGSGEPAGFEHLLIIQAADSALASTTAVTVTTINTAPVFDTTAYTFTLQEMTQEPLIVVGTVTAIDSDNDPLSYSLLDDDEQFSIEEESGVIRYTRSGNPSPSNTYLLTVIARDGNTSDSTALLDFVPVTVTVTNATPTFDTATYSFTLDENESGTVNAIPVGTIMVSDMNNDLLMYILYIGDTSKFNIHPATGVITYIGSGEANGTIIALNVRVSDGNVPISMGVIVEVVGLRFDSPPSGYVFDLQKGRDASSTPITVGTVNAIDSEDNVIVYSIINGNSDGNFSIRNDSNEGVIRYIGTGEADNAHRILTIRAEAGTKITDVEVGITIINDAPVFETDAYSVDLNENISGAMPKPPIVLGTISAFDLNNDVISYFIVNGDESLFSLNSSSGVISYMGTGERLSINHSLTAIASDGEEFDFVEVTVVIINEPSVFVHTAREFILDENQSGVGTAIPLGTVAATDPEDDPILYSITDGDNNNRFSVGSSSGIVNYIGSGEVDGTVYSLTVAAITDNHSVITVVTVTVINNPSIFINTPYEFILNENQSGAENAIILGTLMATDPNFDPINYSISDGDTNIFSIDTVTDQNSYRGIVRYIGSGEVDGTTFSLIVTVNEVTAAVTIRVENEPPGFTGSPYQFRLNENQSGVENAIILGTVMATDPDNDPVFYALYLDGSFASTDSRFSVGIESGIVRYVGSGETFGSTPSPRVAALTVTEQGDIFATTTTMVTVQIINEAPIFNPTTYEFTLEDSHKGNPNAILVGTIRATDPNNDDINYSISGGSSANRFSIETHNALGIIYYIGDGEDPGITLGLTVIADDDDNTSLPAAVTIKVLTTTVPMRTEMTSMTLAQVGRNIAIDTVDVLGGRFDAAPHVTISGNSLDAKQWSRLNRWMQLDHWQSAGAWNGVEREMELDFGFLEQWSKQWDKFQDKLLTETSFLIPLGAAGSGDNIGGVLQDWSIWGQGRVSGYEYTNGGIKVDGLVLSGYLGVDYRINERLLFGVAVSHSNSDGHSAMAVDGSDPLDINSSLTSLYPYVHWTPGRGFELWGAFGNGFGEVEIIDQDQGDPLPTIVTDTEMLAAAFGVKQTLISLDFADIAVKADGFVVQLTSDKVAELNAIDSESHRFRVALSGSRDWPMSTSAYAISGLEFGGRLDGGDALIGQGVDIGVNLGYVNTDVGFEVKSRLRFLVAHSEDYSEWGLDLTVRLRPGQLGRGLSLAFSPGWGQATPHINSLWENGVSSLKPKLSHDRGVIPDRTKLSLSYGLQYHSALLEPFAEMGMDRDLLSSLKLGLKVDMPRLRIEVFGDNAHHVGVEGVLGF